MQWEQVIKNDPSVWGQILAGLEEAEVNPELTKGLTKFFLVVAHNAESQAAKTTLEYVIAQTTPQSELIQYQKSANAEISSEAKQVLEAKYMVVIASMPDQHSAEDFAQQANAKFQ